MTFVHIKLLLIIFKNSQPTQTKKRNLSAPSASFQRKLPNFNWLGL